MRAPQPTGHMVQTPPSIPTVSPDSRRDLGPGSRPLLPAIPGKCDHSKRKEKSRGRLTCGSVPRRFTSLRALRVYAHMWLSQIENLKPKHPPNARQSPLVNLTQISGDLKINLRRSEKNKNWTGLDWTGLEWTELDWTVRVDGLSTYLDWQHGQSIRVDSPVQPDSDQGSPKKNRI